MDKKLQMGIIAIIILSLLLGYLLITPHYKEIEMSGFTFEVPISISEVNERTDNYNTYQDTLNNLNIKTWSCRNINDINGTYTGGYEMGVQLGENMGTPVNYNYFEVYNKSGTYTYFESDPYNACMIIITCDNLDTIEHILETMEKPKSNVNPELINMPSSDLLISNPTVNSNENTINKGGESSSDSTNSNNLHTDSHSSEGSYVSSESSNSKQQNQPSHQQSSNKPTSSSKSHSSKSSYYSSTGISRPISSSSSSSSSYGSSSSSSSSHSKSNEDVFII